MQLADSNWESPSRYILSTLSLLNLGKSYTIISAAVLVKLSHTDNNLLDH